MRPLPQSGYPWSGRGLVTLLETGVMSWFVLLFASVGAALILGALTFVSTLLGVLITSMIVLMCGPIIDRLLARRNRRSV